MFSLTYLSDRIRSKLLHRFPPSADWKYERQTNPPSFGWARRASDQELEQEIQKRKSWIQDVLSREREFCDFDPGVTSLVVLSCRRWATLERLIRSAERLRGVPNLERVLVDNGSGSEHIEKAESTGFFDRVIAFEKNLGMVGALRRAYRELRGQYVLLLEDDFILEAPDSRADFLEPCLEVFDSFPEIGFVRLKNQNNWWKPHRIISGERRTPSGVAFRTWIPNRDLSLNGWCAGSVLFRKSSYFAVGELPEVESNLERSEKLHQGYIYECTYGKLYNERWLAAKLSDHCPFFQPNDNDACEGWGRSQ